MDAFAVAMCKGAASERVGLRHMLTVGIWFGVFQGAMPLIGYFLGAAFSSLISAFDHWIAIILLAAIGVNMIVEALSGKEECACSALTPLVMLPLALATSIDALAVGITFAILPGVNIALAVILIGVVTLLLSGVGVKLGGIFGARFKKYAELGGGAVLVIMGIKILLEHLFFV
jgi:putative Mn2+ efflux pump MntP